MKQVKQITTENQIKPKFKVGQHIIDMFGDELKIIRIYFKDGMIQYGLELIKSAQRKSVAIRQEMIKEAVKDNLYDEEYMINVLMVRPIL